MKNYEEIIAANLRTEIENSAKSKSQIAAEIGISKPTLSQYLSGRIFPSLATFARLCEVLDCSADDILGLRR
ncbi:MAG: helix-turn-helix transcriptional regulator [Clostridia bacterium]|nr:helix-turn-helix transcriptional regulator [Clostridia bacterium]